MIKKTAGFSLVEVLVSITILTILGVGISAIVNRSFRGNTKTELIGNVKQNGQSALAIIEKDIRESDTVVCPSSGTANVLALLSKSAGKYIRISMMPETSQNGALYREELVFQSAPATISSLCDLNSYPLNFQNSQISLLDTGSKTAVSLKNLSGNGFTVTKNSGFKDTVKVQFDLGPTLNSGNSFENSLGGATNSINFVTTVQIR